MTRLQDLKPFDPVFDVEKMMGGVNIGNTPPYVASCSGVLSIVGSVVLSSPTTNGVESLVKDGDFVYISCSTYDGITIVDVSVPTIPVQVGSVTDASMNVAYGIVKSGNYVYVSADISSNGRLTAVDVTNPAAPAVGAGVTNFRMDNPRDIFLDGTLVYVSSMIGTGGMGIIDIATPGTPVYVTGNSASTMNFTNSFAVDGIYCFAMRPSSDAFTVIDITAVPPTLVTTITDAVLLANGQGLVKSGNYCYVVDPGGDLLVAIDVTTPTAPVIAGSVTVLDNPQGMTIVGTTCYVACRDSDSIEIVDITNPAAMVVTGSLVEVTLLDLARNVIADGNYLYALSNTSPPRLVVIDRCT